MSEAAYDASVVIVTKDRQADGSKAVVSAFAQANRVEVIAIDDGSSDGTSAAIAERFPRARLEHFDEPAGCRHAPQLARIARSPFIFSLYGEADFTTPRTVKQTPRLLPTHGPGQAPSSTGCALAPRVSSISPRRRRTSDGWSRGSSCRRCGSEWECVAAAVPCPPRRLLVVSLGTGEPKPSPAGWLGAIAGDG